MANADDPLISQFAEYLRKFLIDIGPDGQELLNRDQGYLSPFEIQRLFLSGTRRVLTNIADGRYDTDCAYYEPYADAYLQTYEYLRTRAHVPARVLLRDHEPSSAEEAFVHDTIRKLLQQLYRPLTYVNGREPSGSTAADFPEEPVGIPSAIMTLWKLNVESFSQRISTREENIRMITFLVRLMTFMAAAAPDPAEEEAAQADQEEPPAAAAPDLVPAAAAPDLLEEAADQEDLAGFGLFNNFDNFEFGEHVDPFGSPMHVELGNFDDNMLPMFDEPMYCAEADGAIVYQM